MRVSISVLASLVLAAGGADALAMELTSCGQVVPARERATLTADLVCAGGLAVELGARSTLDLAGFAIVNTDPLGRGQGVRCPKHSCTIVGPGEIRGFHVRAEARRLEVRDVALRDGRIAIDAVARARLVDVTVDGFDVAGVLARRLDAERLRVSNVTVRHGLAALSVRSLRGTDVEVVGNEGDGVLARRIRATNVIVTDNTGVGIVARRLRLEGATLRDNDALGSGTDLRSEKRPRVRDVSCTRSDGPRGPWGVCTFDDQDACGVGAPSCGGFCPGDGVCVPDLASPDACRCVGSAQPCGKTYPVCGGTCAAGEECVVSGPVPFGVCTCTPIGVTPCGAAAAPACAGVCPTDASCVPLLTSIGGEAVLGCDCTPPGSCGPSGPGSCPAGQACAGLPGGGWFCVPAP